MLNSFLFLRIVQDKEIWYTNARMIKKGRKIWVTKD